MTGLCSRRTLLTIAGAAAVSSITAAHAADGKTSKPAKRTWPDMPTVPTDFNAERCFVELQDAGDGVVFQGPKNGPVVRLAFDTQCPWCVWQYEQLKPFLKQVTFIWHPVAVLNPWSELQGAAILSAKDRKAKFLKRISTTRISAGSMSAMSNCPLMRERRSGTTPKLFVVRAASRCPSAS